MLDYSQFTQKKKKNKKWLKSLGVFFVVVLVLAAFFVQSLFAPVVLSEPKTITIPKGYGVIQIGALLQKEGLVTSALAFRALAESKKSTLKSGPYVFSGEIKLSQVLDRLARAEYGDVYRTVTVPEGSTNRQVAEAIKRSYFIFDQDQFTKASEGLEGYLFPDTYSFLPDTSTAEIIERMQDAFTQKIDPLRSDIEKSGRSLQDIIIMASIIEKEATRDLAEKKIISGILWKRLDEGKLLQVDAPFQYINGRVKAADLRKDGPYNTYTRKGLTPTPIGNPGLDAIKAALYPVASPYYFYLHADQKIYYGENYNQHLNNINRYLR